jgi:hypothetical protein
LGNTPYYTPPISSITVNYYNLSILTSPYIWITAIVSTVNMQFCSERKGG